MKFHLAAAAVSIAASYYFGLNNMEWLVVIWCITLVFAVELMNTAIEFLVDLVSPGQHPLAGKVKDLSAGAVLVTAIGALVSGLVIFLPKIWS
jgi:diacylglycerol kinase (ATP)